MLMTVRRRIVLAVMFVGLVTATLSGAARANEVTCSKNPVTGQEICVVVAGGEQSLPGTPGNRSKSTPKCYRTDVFPPGLAGRVPCTSSDGVWVQSRQCYAKLLDPQPPADFPIWGGHTDGAVYECTFRGPLFYERGFYWSSTPPATPVDPEVLAEQIVRQMALRQPRIGIVPEPGQQRMGFVGLPVYMWVADPGPHTVGPITRSASSSGVTVTATAKAERFVWNMGDGHAVTCLGQGTPYSASLGTRPSPTCGHKYERTSIDRPKGVYPVSVTSYWRVEWTGGGDSGWLEFSFVTSTSIRIGEAQALT